MDLPRIDYLKWAREGKDAKHDLSRSGMNEVPLETLRLGIGDLLLDEGDDWGGPTLRSAIARSYSIPEKNVLPANGTTFAILLVCAALLDRGDRVLVEEPAYEPLRRIPLLFGASIDRLPRPFGNRFRFDRERLVDSITADTKLVILTDPHNPSGVLLRDEERRWLAETAEERNVDILVDEVYIDFDGRKDDGTDSPWRTAFRHGRRMISIGSLTKVYGFRRLRAGWIVAREELIRKAAPLYDYTVGNLSGPSSALAVAALSRREEFRRPGLLRAKENGDRVARWIEKRPDLEWVRPDTGITAFPRLADGGDAAPFLDSARERHGLLAVPGRFFEDPGGFRLGYGIDPAALAEALDHLGAALAERP